MTIDIDRLTRFAIPTAHQDLTPRDIALYALSVGMGQDPLDPHDLDYTDPARSPQVLPSMVLVMAHPGFWMGHPQSGIDPAAILHATQSFQILAPIPRSGRIDSRTRLTGVIDKGPGKAALVLTETDLADPAGQTFARLTRTTFVRGGGGFGGQDSAAAAPPPTPQTPPDRVLDLPTRPEQALLYRLNGDLNPLHSDPGVAARAGFARPILHGLCTMGIVTRALLRGLAGGDGAALGSVSLRFSGPVYPGETIRTEIWADGRFRARVPDRDATVIDQGLARLTPGAQPTEAAHAGH